MGLQAPVVNSELQSQDAIVARVRELAPFYAPEWDATQNTGAGAALLQIFAGLVDDLIQRLNQVPNNNLIAFLNMLGFQLLPAQPAEVPLTFFLSSGATQSAPIPARSQAAASPPGGNPIIFETQDPILATPATLQAVLSLVPEPPMGNAAPSDLILNNLANLQPGKPTTLFDPNIEDLQAHVLYLGDPDLFNMPGAGSFVLTLNGSVQTLADPNLISTFNPEWSWSDANGNWQDFTSVAAQGDQGTVTLTLAKSETREIQQITINGKKSRWIRAKAQALKQSGLGQVFLSNIAVSPASPSPALVPDAAFADDVPLPLPTAASTTITPPWLPFGTLPRQGNAFYIASQEAFSKSGAKVTLTCSCIPWSISGDSQQLSVPAPSLSWEYWNGTGWTALPVTKGSALVPADYTLHSKGSGYNPDDILTLVQPNASDGTIKVISVVENGFIKNFTVTNAGTGYTTGTVVDVTGGSPGSSGAMFNINAKAVSPSEVSESGFETFTVPPDLQQNAINGKSDYWIRVRIASGDYGPLLFTAGNPPDASNVFYPRISSLTLSYTLAAQTPASVVTHNDGAFQTQTSNPDGSFQPFQPLPSDDVSQALYLGFSQAPLDGPISIFFDLVAQAYPDVKPRLEWQYSIQAAGQPWSRLAIVDNTQGLTTSGTVQFLGPADFAALPRYGSTLFWIRAVDVNDGFQPPPLIDSAPNTQAPRVTNRPRQGVSHKRLPHVPMDGGGAPHHPPPPCAQQTAFSPTFAGASANGSPAPVVNGIYLNTAWAIQAQTITNETLGSSDGSQNQKYPLTKSPVVSQQIEVNEFDALSEGERNALAANKSVTTNPVKDAQGKVIQFWITWSPVDDLSTAGPTARFYAIDPTFGTIQFGDGVTGMVPPVGFNNIRATYQFGGGAPGNVNAGAITTLRTTIPLVDHVINLVAAGGGSDTETTNVALLRGPESVKNRDRAVTAEDYKWLAFAASRAVARVSVLPDFNDQGQSETNWVTVLIVPVATDPRPYPSFELRQIVQNYLLARAPLVTTGPSHVQVAGPTYVNVDVSADLYTVSISSAQQLETAAVSELQAFLHPLTGGPLGQGWDFGALPCLSDFYGLLGGIPGVDHLESLSMRIYLANAPGQATTIDQSYPFSLPAYVLIASGNHTITVKLSTFASSS
jgi:hypothetical protein